MKETWHFYRDITKLNLLTSLLKEQERWADILVLSGSYPCRSWSPRKTPSPGCCFVLGHKEDGNCSTGLWSGAEPAPPADTEFALSQEHFSKEKPTAQRTAESQLSQARPCIAYSCRYAKESPRDLGCVISKSLQPFSSLYHSAPCLEHNLLGEAGRQFQMSESVLLSILNAIAEPIHPPPVCVLMSCFKVQRAVKRYCHTSYSPSYSKDGNAEFKQVMGKKVAQ